MDYVSFLRCSIFKRRYRFKCWCWLNWHSWLTPNFSPSPFTASIRNYNPPPEIQGNKARIIRLFIILLLLIVAQMQTLALLHQGNDKFCMNSINTTGISDFCRHSCPATIEKSCIVTIRGKAAIALANCPKTCHNHPLPE